MYREKFIRYLVFIVLCVQGSLAYAEKYTVTNTLDGGPAAVQPGSLAQAIVDARDHAGPDTIVFNIPATDPGYNAAAGVWTIRPVGQLPGLELDGTFIDGASQAAFIGGDPNPYGPEIELDGTNAGGANGIYLFSKDNKIHGLVINRFGWAGVMISGSFSTDNVVTGCYIGTDATGTTALGNVENGIYIGGETHSNRIGGSAAAERNLISGSSSTGSTIYVGNGITLYKAHHNTIVGNYIGTDRHGTGYLPNQYRGISLRGSNYNIIGGVASGQGNIIAGGTTDDIYVSDGDSNTFAGNFIGTDLTGTLDLNSNMYGIHFLYTSAVNIVGAGNTIAYHQNGYGILLEGAGTDGNRITQNAIYGNEMGIGLYDNANAGMASPVITGVGSVTGTAPAGATVEIFSDAGSEGRIFEGSVVADGSGHFLWSGTPAGPYATATATDANGNTSEFSAPFATTGVQEAGTAVLEKFSLAQNYPNPFNPVTTIRFAVMEPCRVVLKVFDLCGREAATLVDGMHPSGFYSVRFDGTGLASGMYFYRIQMGDASTGSGWSYTDVRKMVLLE